MTAAALALTVRLLARTWRFRVEGSRHLADARAAGPVLFAPWHEALIPLVWHHRGQGITLLVGHHGDAGLLATVATGLGYRLARGSSSRGGVAGLRHLIRALANDGDAAVTPDGPRGPRRLVKPGLLRAAQHSGATIVPVTARASRGLRLRSWDRMLVPAPRACVTIAYGSGLTVPRDVDPRDLPARRLQAALEGLERAS